MTPYEQTVYRVLQTIATERQPNLPPLDAGQTLTYDLGLSSLDVARAVATLEFELNADPFVRVPITSVRTVGDLCAAYRLHFNGGSEPPPQSSAEERPGVATARVRFVPEDAAELRRQVRSS
jgi:hypothetical protein